MFNIQRMESKQNGFHLVVILTSDDYKFDVLLYFWFLTFYAFPISLSCTWSSHLHRLTPLPHFPSTTTIKPLFSSISSPVLSFFVSFFLAYLPHSLSWSVFSSPPAVFFVTEKKKEYWVGNWSNCRPRRDLPRFISLLNFGYFIVFMLIFCW